MTDLFKNHSSQERHGITAAIFAGQKIKAIQLYREAVRCDLKTAKQAVEEITKDLKVSNPYAFRSIQRQGREGVVLLIAVLFIVISGALVFFPEVMQKLSNWLHPQLGRGNADYSKVMIIKATDKYATIGPAAGTSTIAEGQNLQVMPESGSDMDLKALYRQKLANAAYVKWKNSPGLPQGYQGFIEELRIKQVRSKIAEDMTLPFGETATTIPLRDDPVVTIDGVIDSSEWRQSVQVPLQPEQTQTILYLQADNEWLYLAADVPQDITVSGYDQLRFYFHIDIDAVIKNERIHVDRSAAKTLGGIRQTTVRWEGEPANNNDERWKRYAISDWRIYRMAQGASSMLQHRQFEAKMNLQESGLHIGVPFAAFVEVETDPLLENGKFKQRVYAGNLGNQQQPVWFLMQ